MASIYSTQFGHGAGTAGATGTLYTVPTGFVAVVRSIGLWNYAGGPGFCAINGPGGDAIFVGSSTGAQGMSTWEGRQVLNPGDTITYDLVSGDWTWLVSGYLLTAP